MKSVEFLVALGLLLILYSWLYTSFNNMRNLAHTKLIEFNNSLQVKKSKSFVNQMISYGEPFKIHNIEFNPALSGLIYNPISGTYVYETYSRW